MARGVEAVRIEVGIRIGVEPRGWRAQDGGIRIHGLRGSCGCRRSESGSEPRRSGRLSIRIRAEVVEEAEAEVEAADEGEEDEGEEEQEEGEEEAQMEDNRAATSPTIP